MYRMVFTIVDEAGGWYVLGGSRIGPFFSQQRAADLAHGMCAAITANGTACEVRYGTADESETHAISTPLALAARLSPQPVHGSGARP